MAPQKKLHYNFSNFEWPPVPTYFLKIYDIPHNIEVTKIAHSAGPLLVTREVAY